MYLLYLSDAGLINVFFSTGLTPFFNRNGIRTMDLFIGFFA